MQLLRMPIHSGTPNVFLLSDAERPLSIYLPVLEALFSGAMDKAFKQPMVEARIIMKDGEMHIIIGMSTEYGLAELEAFLLSSLEKDVMEQSTKFTCLAENQRYQVTFGTRPARYLFSCSVPFEADTDMFVAAHENNFACYSHQPHVCCSSEALGTEISRIAGENGDKMTGFVLAKSIIPHDLMELSLGYQSNLEDAIAIVKGLADCFLFNASGKTSFGPLMFGLHVLIIGPECIYVSAYVIRHGWPISNLSPEDRIKMLIGMLAKEIEKLSPFDHLVLGKVIASSCGVTGSGNDGLAIQSMVADLVSLENKILAAFSNYRSFPWNFL